jgi:hypothetical protein
MYRSKKEDIWVDRVRDGRLEPEQEILLDPEMKLISRKLSTRLKLHWIKLSFLLLWFYMLFYMLSYMLFYVLFYMLFTNPLQGRGRTNFRLVFLNLFSRNLNVSDGDVGLPARVRFVTCPEVFF